MMIKPTAIHTALFLLLSAVAAMGHNGEVAFAAPAANIVVDGDLSDWPTNATRYEIYRIEFGSALVGGNDFVGSFRTAWDPATLALFIGVDIVDDDMHLSGEPINSWRQMRSAFGRLGWRSRGAAQDPPDLPDGCAVIIDVGDNGQPRRFSLDGDGVRSLFDRSDDDLAGTPGVQSAQRLGAGRRQYEWRIELNTFLPTADDGSPEKVAPGAAIGFDVTAVDRDSDGSLSWITWGPGAAKLWTRGNGRADLVLAEAAVSLRDIRGRADWLDSLA
ncbi:MAG: hypothetical protein HOH74_22095, partial [Gemmatimonadetes bacterium]|nr:hypothetical protein [Gemmatimonadota bacterium]